MNIATVKELLGFTSAPDSKTLINYAEECFREARDQRITYEAEWYEALAFYYGHQWRHFVAATGTLEESPAPPWRVRTVHNLILPAVRIATSRICRNRPLPVAEPATDTEEDINSAKTGTLFLRYLHYQLEQELSFLTLTKWFSVLGTAFLKCYWNPFTGPEVAKGIQRGDIEVDVLTPFDIYPDPSAKCEKEVQWIIHARAKSVKYIKDRYDKVVNTEENLYNTLFDENRVAFGVTGSLISGTRLAQTKLKDSALVKELYELPTKTYPKGRFIRWANGVLLSKEDEELPYGFPYPPIIKFDYEELPGRYWGRGIVTPAQPIQAQYNKTVSQIIENKNQMGRPKWFISSTTGISKKSLTSEPGEVVIYQGGLKPEAWTPNDISPASVQLMGYFREDLMQTFGQHEISQGRTPPNVEAGISIQMLLEQDESQLSPTLKNFSNGLSKLGKMQLQLAQKFYAEERKVSVIGESGRSEMASFAGADFSGCQDVRIEEMSQLSLTRTGREQQIYRLLEAGMLGDPRSPNTRKVVLRSLNLSYIEKMLEQEESKAAAEMQQAAQDLENLGGGQDVNMEPGQSELPSIGGGEGMANTASMEPSFS